MMSRHRRRAFRFRKSRLLRDATSKNVPKLPNSLTAAKSGPPRSDWSAPAHRARRGGTWDSEGSVPGVALPSEGTSEEASPTAQVLSLFADPRVSSIDAAYAAKQLELPRQDVQNILGALCQAGYLTRTGEGVEHYTLVAEKKSELEALFMHTLREVHQEQGLVLSEPGQLAPMPESQEDDPRMPMTAGILSLFLPGTGQLLNGDIGRAVLVFAIWALAILAPHPAIIIFVRLYAGAEAFFNAKLRRLAQRRALEAAAEQRAALAPAPASGS